MKDFFKFLFSKSFIKNAIVALIGGLILLFIVTRWIKGYTNHGKVITVKDLSQEPYPLARDWLSSMNLRDTILDSVYEKGMAPHVIVDQNPKAGSQVKKGRMIYLTISMKNPPLIEVPDNLVGKSLRIAQQRLESAGFEIGEIKYIPHQDENAVFKLENNGHTLLTGHVLPKGAKVDLSVGDGVGDTRKIAPCLIGKTFAEAEFKILRESLLVGSISYKDDVVDTASAVIYKQFPSCSNNHNIRMGEAIDLFFQQDWTPELDSIANKYKIDTLINESWDEEGF